MSATKKETQVSEVKTFVNGTRLLLKLGFGSCFGQGQELMGLAESCSCWGDDEIIYEHDISSIHRHPAFRSFTVDSPALQRDSVGIRHGGDPLTPVQSPSQMGSCPGGVML